MPDPATNALGTVILALRHTLDTVAGWNLLPEFLVQVAADGYQFDRVAVGHCSPGIPRRIMVGCDNSLAEFLGRRVTGMDAGERTVATEALERAGFQHLSEILQQALTRIVAGIDADFRLIIQESETFRAQANHDRNFQLYFPTPEGDLHCVVDLSSRQSHTTDRIQWTDNQATGQTKPRKRISTEPITDPERIQMIWEALQTRETDVLVKLADENNQHPLRHALTLETAEEQPGDELFLSSPCLTSDEYAFAEGSKLVVVFDWYTELYQFTTRISNIGYVEVCDDVHLPIMSLAPPTRFEPGQRREAFRVVPSRRISGHVVNSSDVSSDMWNKFDLRGVPVWICDLSATGIRLDVQEQTLVSRYRWGCQVLLALELPEPFGYVELPAVTRRTLLLGDNHRQLQLCLEFLRDDNTTNNDLDTIRRFVLQEQENAVTPLTRINQIEEH
ncbi:MAG: hypothetical protein ABIF77_08885 [bacterium]